MLMVMLCTIWSTASAQDSAHYEPRWWLGVGGGYGTTLASGEIVALGFDPSCGTITKGSGSFFSGLLLLERHELFGSDWRGQIRAGVRRSQTTLEATDAPPQLISRPDGSVVEAIVGQRMETDRTNLDLALLGVIPFGRATVHVGVGGSSVLAHSERHLQVAVAPEDLLLVNNQRTFELGNGELLSPSLGLGLLAGFGYDFPLARSSRLVLVPELQLYVPLKNEVEGMSEFRIGLGATIRFALDDTTITPSVIDTTPPHVALRPPTVAMTTIPSTVGVEIDEYDSLEVLPLLNRIFFERESVEIPGRYHLLTRRESGRFTGAELTGSALDVYHDILNIIGKRMAETPRATLRITGTRSGSERTADLTRGRAEAVRRYLVETWGIAERRITVRGGATPAQAVRENTPQGEEENARAEIESNDPTILSPWLRVFTQRVATPPELVFQPGVVRGDAPVAQWQLNITRSDSSTWRLFSGTGVPPASIRWDWRSSEGDLPTLPISLRYNFTAVDTAGGSTSTGVKIIPITYNVSRDTLHHRVGDSTIESYSLLLFDYDSASVSRSDRPLLEAIAERVGPGARVTIIGYTDSLGEADYNRRLATSRARSVAARLETLVPRTVRITVDESGGEFERFPYNTPEGRQHCRTVFIFVRTPVPPRP